MLQGLYQNDIRIKQIAAGISLPDPKIRVALTNLRGSSINFIGTAVWQLSDANHVFILNDREEAAYFHNDLEHLTGALDICYFPDSFKKAGSYNELNSSHVMLRTEALTKFSKKETHKKVLVTYPEALFEKVVNPNTLSGNMISIKVGENLK
ncbi:MAG: transcription-repair coupling factor, partial [Taibaiella sp.]|nr:transcription-repair coupling factor [Taibaiella sp.]